MPLPKKQQVQRTKKKTKGSVLDRIKPVHFDKNDGIKILLYGRSGTGKTTVWSTFPSKILSIICSNSKKSGELRSVFSKEMQGKIETVTPESMDELLEIAEYLNNSEDYLTAVIDHITGLQDLMLREILGRDELPQQKSWGLVTQQQYGQCTLKCKEVIRAFLDLDINTVLVAQEREFNVESGDDILTPYVSAGLTPSLRDWVNSVTDYICQTFIREQVEKKVVKLSKTKTKETEKKTGKIEYCLRTGPSPIYTTKFRMPGGVSEDVIVNPTYDKVIELIFGS